MTEPTNIAQSARRVLDNLERNGSQFDPKTLALLRSTAEHAIHPPELEDFLPDGPDDYSEYDDYDFAEYQRARTAGRPPSSVRQTTRSAAPDPNSRSSHTAPNSGLGTPSSGLNPPLTHALQQVDEEVMEQVATGHEQVTSAEPKSTSSHLLKRSKRCAAQNKRTGNQCRAWSTASGYCVFHDPAFTESLQELRARGGRSPRRILVGEARKLDFKVMDRGGIQALIAQVLRLQLLGVLAPRQASQATKLIGHLISNAREMPGSDEAAESFEQTASALLDSTDTIAAHLDGREMTDRTNAIADIGAKRQEYLKANEQFAPRPTYRSARDYPYR